MIIEGHDKLLRDLAKLRENTGKINNQIYLTSKQVKNDIVMRTRQGNDINGSPFKAYSTLYSNYKEENNRNATPVTLTYSGNMLNFMDAKSINNGAEIYFKTPKEGAKAKAHNEGLKTKMTVKVKEHKRKITEAFGKKIKTKIVTVKAHTKTLNIKLPKREFFGLSKENQDYYLKRIDALLKQID